MFINQIFEGLRNTCKVCGQTPCNCTHIAESADPQSRKLGRIIGHIYNEIYDMGDDALDYLNDRAPVWAELWDRYEGDIDSIIAEEDPVTLGKAALELKDILNDLQSDQGVAEEKVRLDPKCWSGKKIGNPKTKMKGGVRVNNCVPAESVAEGIDRLDPFTRNVLARMEDNSWLSAERAWFIVLGIQKKKQMSRRDYEEEIQRYIELYDKYKGIGEGWKEKLGAAALTGAMALGAAGAHARVTGDEDPSVNRLTGKPNVTQQATDTAPTSVEAPKGFSKEYLQKAADPNRVGRYLISVEKAQELLSNMKEGAEHDPKDHEADYGKEYQDTVKRAGHAVKNIEKKFGPVDISSLAKRLNDIEQGKK